MDTLVVIGDLTASESFPEGAFFVDNNLFSVLRNALESASISALENFNMSSGNTGFNIDSQKVLSDLDLTEYTKIRFQEIIVWILHNAVADDPTC